VNAAIHESTRASDPVYVKATGAVTEFLDRSGEKPHISFALLQPATAPSPVIDGLWVLLVSNEGELTTQDPNGRVPVMARAGNDQTYLLVFKDVVKARRFVADTELDGAEPRMVVRGNREDIIRIARSAGVVGVLQDYDAKSQKYAAATALA
jgi:hypothetical protein